MKRRDWRATFIATDATGSEYRIHLYQWMLLGNTTAGPYEEEGLRELVTQDGRHVNYVSQGQYDLVDADGFVRLTSDDPDAP